MSFLDLVSHVAGNFEYEKDRSIAKRGVPRIIDVIGYIRMLQKSLRKMEKDRLEVLDRNPSQMTGKVWAFATSDAVREGVDMTLLKRDMDKRWWRKYGKDTAYTMRRFVRIDDS